MTAAIDVWAQPSIRPREGRLPLPETNRVFARSGAPPPFSVEIGADEMLAEMDRAGVAQVLLSAWHRPGGWVVSNDDVAEFTAKHPDRLKGLAAVDLARPVEAVRELRRAVSEHGCVGLRIMPWLWELPPTDRLYYPLYVACCELGVPVCTQVGHTGPLKPSETGRPIPYIDEIALTFPDLGIVGGHVGYPWTDEMIAVAWKHDNVFIDTSAYLPRYYPRQLLHFLETYGRDKVLFGTNWPQLRWDVCMEQVGGLALSEGAKEAFLHTNAARVFGLT